MEMDYIALPNFDSVFGAPDEVAASALNIKQEPRTPETLTDEYYERPRLLSVLRDFRTLPVTDVEEVLNDISHSSCRTTDTYYSHEQAQYSPCVQHAGPAFFNQPPPSTCTFQPLYYSAPEQYQPPVQEHRYNTICCRPEWSNKELRYNNNCCQPEWSNNATITKAPSWHSSVTWQPVKQLCPVRYMDYSDERSNLVGDMCHLNGPQKARRRRRKNPQLWQFILNILADDNYNPELIKWINPQQGIFKFVKSKKVAHLWGLRKNKEDMTYEHLSRGLRHYYKQKIMIRTKERLVYQFKENADGWVQVAQTWIAKSRRKS